MALSPMEAHRSYRTDPSLFPWFKVSGRWLEQAGFSGNDAGNSVSGFGATDAVFIKGSRAIAMRQATST